MMAIKQCVLNSVFVAVALTGCKKTEGQSCEANEECGEGLMCIADRCAIATKVMKQRVRNLQRTAQQYMHQNQGGCPPVEELAKPHVRTDPWGNEVVVQCPSEHSAVDVVSLGPDGELGTDDDITSYQADSQ